MTTKELQAKVNEVVKCDYYGACLIRRRIVMTSMKDVKDVVIHDLYNHRHSISIVYHSDTQDNNQYILEDIIY